LRTSPPGGRFDGGLGGALFLCNGLGTSPYGRSILFDEPEGIEYGRAWGRRFVVGSSAAGAATPVPSTPEPTMRTRLALHATTLALFTTFALAACGDDAADGTGSGSGGGSGGAAGTTSADSTSTGPSTTTSTAATTSSSGDGGGTGEGGGAGGGTGEGGAGGATGSGGSELAFQPLWQDVAYPEDGGRLDIESFVGVTLQVRAAGTEEVALELPNQALPAGIIVHAYAIGLASEGTLDAFVVQDDSEFAAPDAGEGNIRLAHFSPDVPAVDVYLLDQDFLMYGPLLETDSFDFPSMSRYGSFPDGTYEATIVPTGGDPFGEAYGVFPGIEIVAGTSSTLALIGLDGDSSLDFTRYGDDMTEPADGHGAVTFVHAAPDAPNVDVGALLPVD
jgi:hypothetical protein